MTLEELTHNIITNMPSDWLRLTTHRLDVYNEPRAKVEFLEKLESVNKSDSQELANLPTAFDYIRLGHPLSCVLEWGLAKINNLPVENVISFASESMPLFAILRKNKFLKKKTRIIHSGVLPANFDEKTLKSIYQYDFEVVEKQDDSQLEKFEGTTVVINGEQSSNIDIILKIYRGFGSVIEVLEGPSSDEYVKEIQHVRRRESIAMTPNDCLKVLKGEPADLSAFNSDGLSQTINDITSTKAKPVLGNCGLSVQYAIMMGLTHHAIECHPGKNIAFIVPPNCYGGTNDQARRVAACVEQVEIIDLPVDSGKDMVTELERILTDVGSRDIIPYIVAEIPTNPRVEIPDLQKLRLTLKEERKTQAGEKATPPVFILDQTFCPNVKFFGEDGYLHDAATISYVSGSKFPSGGLCTAGYCVANAKAENYMEYVQKHLELCNNGATNFQGEVLTNEMPTMNERIAGAYKNTRAFVDYIEEMLPEANINFVSNELADANFTPSVFSLDLPTKGESHEARESYKRELNHKLIRMMIEALPDESKHCVSYGQLKGCYWTIPATSTQGTTKESDKDYIVRVSMAANLDLEGHKEVFKNFCSQLY